MAQTLTQTCARCGAESAPGARFCSSCGAPLGDVPREERRLVTIVFGDLAGFTELAERRDAEEVKGIVDRAFASLGEIISSHGGRVDKVIGDEIMAVFGAPQAHEDDAERAVRAALAMRRWLDDYSSELERARGIRVQMHIGVNTGEVVAGFVGGSDAYTVIGDAVNTARRIGDAAEPGQILVGQATYDASRAAIEYRSVGSVSAKNKRLPVPVWEATSERGLPGVRASRGAPLTGRQEELALLDALAAIVRRDHRAHAVTIIGEAGMGKSRLASEFARRVSAAGARVLGGRSLPYGTSSPAFALEEMLRAALLVPPGASEEDARAWVRERLGALGAGIDHEAVLAFLGLGGQMPARDGAGSAGPAATAPSTRLSPLLETAVAVLERVAEREELLVLAFHELHWAQDDVLEAIEATLRRGTAPMLVLCLARPELLERRPGWASGLGSTLLSIEPLSRERAAALLDALAPGLPHGVHESILDRAGGNPFYLEELARLLLDRSGDDRIAVPASVQALVTARLDALDPADKRLLQDAAVVGERFWPGLLVRIEPGGAPDVIARLEELAGQGFIEPDPSSSFPDEPGYRFRQTLVREVAYASVPKHVRAPQHARVGAWLEEAAADAGTERELYDLIAYHFESAATLAADIGAASPEAESKAKDYLARAGEAALGRDAAAMAAHLLARALAFDDADLAIRLRLAEALIGIGNHAEGEEHLRRVLVGVRASGDRSAEARALRLLGDSFRMRGDRERAAENLGRALEIAKKIGDEREEAEGLRSQGLLDMIEGRWSSSTLWFRQALARYRALGDARGEGWALQNLGWASMLMGKLDEALQYLAEAQAVFDTLGDEEGSGWCLGMRGWVLLMRGDIMEAGRIAEELEHHLLAHHPDYLQQAAFVLELQKILRSYVSVLLGHLGEAEAAARDAVENGDFQDALWAQSLGHFPIAAVAIMQRRFVVARASVDAGSRAAERFGDPFYIGLFRFARTWLALEDGALDEAAAELEGLFATGELGSVWDLSSSGRWLRASLLRAQGDPAAARAVLGERIGRQNIGLVSPARARVLLARLALDVGDTADAIEQARGAVEDSGAELVARAYAYRTLAEALLAAGDHAAADDAALGALDALAASDWEVERIRALIVRAKTLDALRRHDEASEAFDDARARIASLPPDTETSVLDALMLA